MNLADQPVVPVAVASPSTEVDIPFNKLHISRKNTRIKPHSAPDIECRAASILAYGVLNRLQVINEQGQDGNTEFGVIAGAGRFFSIELLVQRGLLPEDYPVKCDLRSEDDAIAISLAENANRTPPHEADEFVAFKALADEGKSPETVAAHFGVSVRTVQQRMRLGGLHPELLDLYRNGKMGPEEVRAFCRSADQERQLQVWNALPQWNRTAHIIRNQLAQDSLGTNHPLVVFVGLDAYKQAGGVVTGDLFSQDANDGFLEDLALLHQLAVDKLRTAAADIVAAEGWSWSDFCESFDHRLRSQFDQAKPERREATEAEQDELARIAAEVGHLKEKRDSLYDALERLEAGEGEEGDEGEARDPGAQATGEASGESAEEALSTQIEEVEQQISQLNGCAHAITQALQFYSDEVRATGGVIVALDGRGGMDIVRGLIRREEKPAEAPNQPSGSAAPGTPTASGTSVQPSATGTGLGFTQPKKERSEISERLAFQLSARRTAAMQALTVANPQVALAATVHRMLDLVTRRYRSRDDEPVKISATGSFQSLHDKAPDLKGTRASDEVQARIDAWRERIPAQTKDEFAWLLQLPSADLLDLLALCVALTLDVTTGVAGKQPGGELATALELDVADYWTATEASYFGAVSKETIIAAVEEACGPGSGMPIVKMKKGEAVKYAEQKIAQTRWLPAMLRAPAAKAVATDVPATDASATEAPATDAAVTDAATIDTGTAETPATAVATDAPVTALAATDAAATDSGVAEAPATEAAAPEATTSEVLVAEPAMTE
ncbi:ParB/RepB/Spo0J family partition protein [Massilia sp. H6]|uniref:ParB/RepB/Spo0J family partition protein n=1 Tax=Massilia sp. H6 TaxID=2970464 RepID=UPI00216799BC|nr:ParB/RepB/Spo0J family partition protein [Massilia sp. H6]UVW30569.1 hypothetical protein NRS07_19800 [Massilia sp. H6]